MASNQTRRMFLGMAGAGATAAFLAGGASVSAAPGAAATAGPAPIPFRLGMASYTLRKFTLDQTIALTKQVGLDYICLKSFHLPLESSPGEIAQAAAKVRRAGLTLYGGGVITMNNEAQISQAFEYAKAAGMRTIVAAPAPTVLPLVNDKVKQYGFQVAIHNHGPGDKTWPTPQSIYEEIGGLDPRVGLCIDVGHTLRIGADPVGSARQYADRVLDVHIKDVTAATPEGKEAIIGRGVVDIPNLLRTLVAIKFAGVVSFEYEKDPDDPMIGLAESVGYVKGVLAGIAVV